MLRLHNCAKMKWKKLRDMIASFEKLRKSAERMAALRSHTSHTERTDESSILTHIFFEKTKNACCTHDLVIIRN